MAAPPQPAPVAIALSGLPPELADIKNWSLEELAEIFRIVQISSRKSAIAVKHPDLLIAYVYGDQHFPWMAGVKRDKTIVDLPLKCSAPEAFPDAVEQLADAEIVWRAEPGHLPQACNLAEAILARRRAGPRNPRPMQTVEALLNALTAQLTPDERSELLLSLEAMNPKLSWADM